MTKLNNMEWINLINEKREEITEAMQIAYRKSLESDLSGWQYCVELYSDGDIEVVGPMAQNSFSQSSYEGHSMYIKCFDCRMLEIEGDNEIQHLEETAKDRGIEFQTDEYTEMDYGEKLEFWQSELDDYCEVMQNLFNIELEYEIDNENFYDYIDYTLEQLEMELKEIYNGNLNNEE